MSVAYQLRIRTWCGRPGFAPGRGTPCGKALSLQLLSLFGERLLIRMWHIIVHAGKTTLYLYIVEVHIRGGCPRNCSSSLFTPCKPLLIPIFLLIYSTASGGLGPFRKKRWAIHMQMTRILRWAMAGRQALPQCFHNLYGSTSSTSSPQCGGRKIVVWKKIDRKPSLCPYYKYKCTVNTPNQYLESWQKWERHGLSHRKHYLTWR